MSLSADLVSRHGGKAETIVADVRQHGSPHLQAVLNGLGLGLLSFDRSLTVLFANDRLGEILTVAAPVLRRCTTVIAILEASALLADDTVCRLHEAFIATAAGNAPPDHQSFTSVCGRIVFNLRFSSIGDATYLACFEDATAQRAAASDTLHKAMRDPLTTLFSRAQFQDRVTAALLDGGAKGANGTGRDGAARTGLTQGGERAFASHEVVTAVMLIDLDRFKTVNDTLGHPIGDALLRLVARRLSNLIRQTDVAARLGGDEFALLVSPAHDHAGMATLAARVVNVLGRPYLVEGHLVNIGASIGIAQAPADGCEYAILLKNADLALYASKNAGRNTYNFFDSTMDARALARRDLEIDLRRALALQEFELFYQPQIDLETGLVAGFEALLRWRHPVRGLVPPTEFIPLAEEIGLIESIGEWVMREACCQAAGWPDTVSIAVNVSAHQFDQPLRLVAMIAASLARFHLAGHRLEVEITESVLLRNEAPILDALHRIRAMGVRVAMDDFGTGYSSFSQLQSFPFDKIKIDRSFLEEGGDHVGQNAIIRTITALGASLGMSTIAEGVETLDQLARIRAEGCTSVQGYIFSRPVPQAQVTGLIAASFAQHVGNPPMPTQGS